MVAVDQGKRSWRERASYYLLILEKVGGGEGLWGSLKGAKEE